MSEKKIDFLRHIVNYVLASKIDIAKQVADDVRKMVEKAEEKYKFSAFGGDVKRLVDYLRSPDFDELVKFLRDAGKIDLLDEILRLAKEKYKNIPEIVEAIDARLKALGKEKEELKEVKEAFDKIVNVVGDRAIVERLGTTLTITIKGIGRIIVSYDPVDKSYNLDLEITGSKKKVSLNTIIDVIEALLRLGS